MARARNKRVRLQRLAVACIAIASLSGSQADARPRERLAPFQIPDAQYEPLAWRDVAGWQSDDPLGAIPTLRASCAPVLKQTNLPASDKALAGSLRAPCEQLAKLKDPDSAAARDFFEKNYRPVAISKLGDAAGFVTGYYEPVIDGALERSDEFSVPVYRRPSNLFVRGYTQDAGTLPNKGEVFRKIGRRKLVPYYDRAEIEDGAIAKRGLEIAWLRSHTDLLFSQIQGSARVRLADGSFVRINYDSWNGHPYTPVGRALIERGIIPREQMSMQRIREYMSANPDAAKELRRMNRSFVFFRKVNLSDGQEAVGAQGIPLTPGRSIAVDRLLHVYGTPFFISGELPVSGDTAKDAFNRLMIAQDTGSAIIGPARADLFFGAGDDAGRVAGRIRHPARFVMLVPAALDPVARGRTMPLPLARPSAKIKRLEERAKAAEERKLRKQKRKKHRSDAQGSYQFVELRFK